ncbi:Low temperature viability protein-domain-containing protein [Crucibulum laeve]|uniref:Low temperature viability protein-domain-containing protein n=1 Tax=Crucibulum laeve TaxID=68775 RepID=A0A5C3M8Z1_9AGAR|nr:Low temperature viability protein-domain-containing protein [Crucibulum laeve]
MPPKSIFRQPGAKHFQLVHRSQRDPLIHDPDASAHVLKPFERDNAKKGKSRADLEAILPPSEINNDRTVNVGEASLYGVYYDDTEYDYMQHLRQVGIQEDGVDSVLIEARSSSAQKSKSKTKHSNGLELKDLPQGVLASSSQLPRTYESQQAIPESIAGFQPDMNPHLRQVLEALEDEAFVDDDLEDDFFGELVAAGELNGEEDLDFDFNEDGVEEQEDIDIAAEVDGEIGWEERFAQFKKMHKISEVDGLSENEFGSEGDTVGGLPTMSIIGGKGKRRRKGTSEASGYSMSSSSMYRNEALQTLDERFDQIVLKEYNEDDDEAPPSSDEDAEEDEEAPELITSRDDFNSMVNEFLNDYEILGRKMRPVLTGESGVEKLDTLRRAMGQDERVRITALEDEDINDDDLLQYEVEDRKDTWDCETILTTYSNLENHPRLIRARDPKIVPKIHLDPKTGLPSVTTDAPTTKSKSIHDRVSFKADSDESSEDTETESRVRQTIARARGESKEEKRARKSAVKAERQTRRAEKKATKEKFGVELKVQKTTIENKEKRLKKL